MGKTLADGYLELRLDPSKLDADTKRAFKQIGFRARGQEAGKSLGQGLAEGLNEKGGALVKAAAASAAQLSLLAAAASAATPAVAGLAAAVAPAAGALVALPAAISAVKVATATFKVAVMGVGEAIQAGFSGSAKEAKAALEELPPAARKFASSIIDLKPQVEGLRKAVAGRFFAPLQDEVTPLAKIYLPLLKREMADLAGPLGGLGERFAKSARKADVYRAVSTLFQQTGNAVVRLRPAVDAATTGFASLIQATAPFLPRIAESISNAVVKLGGFVTAAAKSGKIKALFESAVDTLKDLGAILGNIGRIFATVFSASGIDGGGLLTHLKEVTGQVATFLKAGEGNTALVSLFSTLSTLGQAMRTALGAVLPAIAQSVTALAPAIGSLAPHFAAIVVALAPLLPYVSQLTAQVLTALVPAVSSLATWLGQNEDVLKNFAIALGVAYGALKLYQVWTVASTAASKAHAAAIGLNTAAKKLWNSTAMTRIRIWALDAAATIRSTAVTVANTVATTANRVATALGTAVLRAFVAVKTFELGAWIRTTAATVANTVATIAATVASKAIRAATIAWTAVQWLLNAALTANPIGLVVAAIAALVAIVVVAYKRNETFRNIVNAVWASIKTAIKATADWFVNTLWPSLKRAYEQLANGFGWLKDKVVGAWNTLKNGINLHWVFVRDKIFNPLKDFITKTIPDAFRTGVAGITRIWEGVKEAARKPVRFVVDTVINQGIIGTFNKVSGFFGGPKADPVSLPRGFGDGPGHNHGGPAGKRTGDGPGDILGFVKGPADWIRGKVGGAINRIGSHPFGQMLKGMSTKLMGGLIDKAKSLIDFSEFAGGGTGAGGLQAGISGALAALRSAFGSVPLISGLRPGATTLSGRTSYHASGRAIDLAPVRAWAVFLNAAFGPQLRELITPWQDLNLQNGRPKTYTGAVWNQHNFAGGNAHIHAAMDDGGMRVLRPGLNLIPNWTGALEPIAGPNAMAALAGGGIHVHIHNSVITSERQAVDLVVKAVKTARRERKL